MPSARAFSLSVPGGPLLDIRQSPAGWTYSGDRSVRLGDWQGRLEPYLEWTWNGASLRVRTDPLGLIPLFLHVDADRLLMATDIHSVLHRLPRVSPDDDAIALFLRTGSYPGARTAFKAVVRAPAGFDWHPHRSTPLSTSQHHGPARLAPGRSRDEILDGFIDVVRSAVLRRSEDDIVLPLSGGRDSRHILLEMLRVGRRPVRVVTAQRRWEYPDLDAILATEVARRFGLPHTVVSSDPLSGSSTLEGLTATSLESCEHGWFAPLANAVARVARPALDGLGGDALTGQALFAGRGRRIALTAARRRHELIDDVLSARREATLTRILDPDAHRRWARDRAVAALEDDLSGSSTQANPWLRFHLEARTRRNVALQPIAVGRSVNYRFPFLDPSVVAFMMSVESEHLATGRFHDDALQRAFGHSTVGRFDLSQDELTRPLLRVRRVVANSTTRMHAVRRMIHWSRENGAPVRLRPSPSEMRYSSEWRWAAQISLYLSVVCGEIHP